MLVGADGDVLFEDHNRTRGGDQTRHPELLEEMREFHRRQAERRRVTRTVVR